MQKVKNISKPQLQDCFAGCRSDTQQIDLAASLASSAGGLSKRFWNYANISSNAWGRQFGALTF